MDVTEVKTIFNSCFYEKKIQYYFNTFSLNQNYTIVKTILDLSF